jgi:hypothetical protein
MGRKKSESTENEVVERENPVEESEGEPVIYLEEFSKGHIERLIADTKKDKVVRKKIFKDIDVISKAETTSGKWVLSNSIYEDILKAVKLMNNIFPRYLIVSRKTANDLMKIKYPQGYPNWWVIAGLFGKSLGDPSIMEYLRVCDMRDDIALISNLTFSDVVMIEID